jgi:hypothetical protein
VETRSKETKKNKRRGMNVDGKASEPSATK